MVYIYKAVKRNSEITEHKMMVINSFTAANIYNFGAQKTKQLSHFLAELLNLVFILFMNLLAK